MILVYYCVKPVLSRILLKLHSFTGLFSYIVKLCHRIQLLLLELLLLLKSLLLLLLLILIHDIDYT
jgi:hypothetical protein